MDVRSFRYETLEDLAQVLRPDDSLLVWDIKDAYHHLRLREEDRNYLAFTAMGRTFVPATMPSGLRPAPYIFANVIRPLIAYLRALGLRVISFVDDFCGAPPAAPGVPATATQAKEGFSLVPAIFLKLDLWLHTVKGVRNGTTEPVLLGHIVNTGAGQFQLPTDKASKIAGLATQLLRRATAHRRYVSFRTLRVFCGTAVSTTLSVTPARFYRRSLFNAMGHHYPRSGDA